MVVVVYSFTILIEYLISAIILIKGRKVDFLCLKKRVWFYWECFLISCVFQLTLVKLLIVFFCLYGVMTELN